ncbi:MAG: flavodoxin family protein [Phycisphaerae bacterium]|nr:flavodoxin family protein [Phycisphaerae bacterium]
MKVVAFNGSPRPDGNTQQMIEKVFEVLRAKGIECERVDIARKPLRGCTACYGCTKNGGTCVLDDELNDWFDLASKADAVLIGSPTYFANVTAETKAFLDRVGFLARVTGALIRKPLAGIVAVRRGGAVPTVDAINHMGLINQMLIVGSTYWNFAVGMDKGDCLEDQEGMKNMENLGENLAWLLEKLNT